MKRLSFTLLAFSITATITGVVLAGNDGDAATLNQISGYRQWTRVNSEPVKIEVAVSMTAGVVAIPASAPV